MREMSWFDWLLEHDQDKYYRIRDYCRELIAADMAESELVIAFLKNTYEWRHSDEEWQRLADDFLADTQELVAYERENGLPVES